MAPETHKALYTWKFAQSKMFFPKIQTSLNHNEECVYTLAMHEVLLSTHSATSQHFTSLNLN